MFPARNDADADRPEPCHDGREARVPSDSAAGVSRTGQGRRIGGVGFTDAARNIGPSGSRVVGINLYIQYSGPTRQHANTPTR